MPKTYSLHRPRATATKPITVPWHWPQEYKDALGMPCIWKARQALDQLRPPFMIERTIPLDDDPPLVMKIPCFEDDPHYQKELGLRAIPDRRALWRKWQTHRAEIETHLASIPDPARTVIERTLSLLKERDRLYAARTHCTIRWFLNAIKRERKRLTALQKAARTPSLFPTCALTECDTIRDRLDQAEKIVTKAKTILEPARILYLSKKSPSQGEAYRVILQALHSVPGVSKYKATQHAKALLDFVDAGRSITFNSLRQRFYK